MKNDILNKDGHAFWKLWKKLNDTCDSGKTDAKEIANTFASYFESVYGNHDTPEHEALKTKFGEKYAKYFQQHQSDNSISNYFFISWSEMMDIVSKIKIGKSSIRHLQIGAWGRL